MQNPVDEATSGTLEQLGRNRPWLARELQEHRLFYLYASVLYAAEDALNLVFSYFSLGEALNDSFHGLNDAGSVNEFHDYGVTPEGLAVTIACATFLVAFSSLGTYFGDSENKDNLLRYYIALFWPYVRDMLKAFKWAYKGIRSTLSVILQLSGHQQALYLILFPIATVLALLAVLNRIWIRAMKAERKEMMKINEQLCEKIVERGNALSVKSEKPSAQDALAYLDSFIYVKNDKVKTKEVYYVRRVANEEGKVEAKLELIDPDTLDFTTFDERLQILQSENLCRRMSLNLMGADEGQLHFLDKLPTTSRIELDGSLVFDSSYANSVIFLTNPNLSPEETFYKVDSFGVVRRYAERGAQFETELVEERKKKTMVGITYQQIFRLIPNDLSKNYNVRDNSDWATYRDSNETEYAAQKGSLPFRCYLATAFSALIDGLYFYMGVLFVVSLNPHAFLAMLAISSLLFVICFASRMYEEYDFQRKLELTQTKVKMALCEAECRYLEIQLESVLAQSQHAEDPPTPAQLITQLQAQLVEYDRLQRVLESQIVFSLSSAIMEGLKNGLSFQGVICSLMFLTMAIMIIAATPCSPIFVITMLSVGMVALFACLARYVASYQSYIQEVRAQKSDLNQTWKAEYTEALRTGDVEAQKRILFRAKSAIDARSLKPPPQFYLVEWCEVFRLLLSGIVKGEKTFGEVTHDRAHDYDETWAMLVVSILFSGVIGAAFMFRAVKKMFGPVYDGDQPVVAVPIDDVSFPPSYVSKFGIFNKKNTEQTPVLSSYSHDIPSTYPNATVQAISNQITC
ncbi:MAG: hypothetical protein Q8R24_06820 [Legionellaceae bacterium]|nr:hypothetical protein [Legionellaceae bacterium]